MSDYVHDLLENYKNPESILYTAEELALRIAKGDNHHADYMWLLARSEKAEADLEKWKGIARNLADELGDANSKLFPVSWEDANETSPAWIAYCNLRDQS